MAGALIVQPSVHKFDHAYVTAALRAHPGLFRGMALANPTLEAAAAVAELERLHAEGYVGLRFNPYLFPDGMDSPVGHALYKRAGELQMPVGVMCFQGLLECPPAPLDKCDIVFQVGIVHELKGEATLTWPHYGLHGKCLGRSTRPRSCTRRYSQKSQSIPKSSHRSPMPTP